MQTTSSNQAGERTHNEAVLKRVLWLAFKSSAAMGMGFLHAGAASQVTEDKLWEMVGNRSAINTDYVMGRMMKTTFELKDGRVTVSPEKPRLDYQSWGADYASGADLVAQAELELGI